MIKYCMPALISLMAAVCFARDLPQDAPVKPAGEKSIHDTATAYRGSSGINPHLMAQSAGLEKDEYFVADRGGHLDRYLYRSNTPRYQFDILIDRYFGETANKKIRFPEQVGLPKTVPLTLNVYDVDDDYQGGEYAPEVDHIYLNGHPLRPFALSSGNERWNVMKFDVPLEYLNFPENPGEKGSNRIEIPIDVANKDSVWAIEVDWAMLEIKALRPILLLHGYRAGGVTGGNADSYDNISAFLAANNIPHEKAIDGWNGNASFAAQAASLVNIINDTKNKYGVEKLNIIAHSKGGIDARLYLRNNGSRSVQTFIQAGPPNHGQNIAGALGVNWTDAAGQDLDPESMRDTFNYFKTDVPGNNWMGISHFYQFTPRYHPDLESVRGGLFVGIGDKGEDDDNWYGVSHRSATLPWKVECHEKQGVLTYRCPELVIRKPLFSHRNTWPTRVVVDKILAGGPHGLNSMTLEHYGWMLQTIRGHSGFAQVPIKAFAQTKAGGQAKSGPNNFSLNLDNEEVVYQNIPNEKSGTASHSFLLQQGVPVKVSAYVSGAPSATVVLKSPSGVETAIRNTDTTDFLAQHSMTPAEAGMWTAHVSGVGSQTHAILVTRQRSPSVALDAGLTEEIIASGASTTLYAYLYDPQKAATTDFADLPKTVSYRTQTVEASVMLPDGTSQGLTLRDDGKGGDALAGDGFYMASYTPPAGGRLGITVKSIRDGEIQLSRDRPLALTVTNAATSQVRDLSAPSHTTDAHGSHENIQYTISAYLAEPGTYYMTAAIEGNLGVHLSSIKSRPVTVSAPGVQDFQMTLERDFVLRNRNVLPLKIKSAFLTFLHQSREELVDHKNFDATVPYTDAALFEEKKAGFLGIQAVSQRDTNGNGFNDQLVIRYRIAIPLGNAYRLQSSIGDKNGEVLEWSNIDFSRNGVDIHDIEIAFDLRKLKASGQSEFFLRDVALFGDLLGADPNRYPISIDMQNVEGYALPDLQVRSDGGSAIEFKAMRQGSITVYNGGGQTASNIPWEARLNSPAGPVLSSGSIAALPPASGQTVKIVGEEKDLQGATVYVQVNPQRSIVEADYANNLAIFRATLPSSSVVPGDVKAVPLFGRASVMLLSLLMVAVFFVLREKTFSTLAMRRPMNESKRSLHGLSF